SFEGQYHRLVNAKNMGKVRQHVAEIRAESSKHEAEALLAKYKEAAKGQGLVVTEVNGEIRIEKPAAEEKVTDSQIVTVEDSPIKLDEVELDSILKNVLSAEEEK
ncbi:MAG: hypothetical protein ACW987_20030, partial [Candidatus Thorarchaeota archaeon]